MIRAALALSAALAFAPAHAEVHRVKIEGMKFVPERIEVKAGDTVVWTNADVVPHTVTGPAKSFDSGTIAPGASWKTVAKAKGDLPYVCRFHPGMKGTLAVR